jgi:hypothetical protein
MKWARLLIPVLLASVPSPSSAAIAQAAPATAAVNVDAIEITQAIQDLRDSVPLIAGKLTIVRVYLSTDATSQTTISGTAILSHPGGATEQLSQLAPFTWTDDLPLQARRQAKDGSLNFLIPQSSLVEGNYAVALTDVRAPERPLNCVNCASSSKPFMVQADAPLFLRIVGFRYPTANSVVEPSAVDFDAIESWLQDAYPIGRLISSRITVDMPELAKERDCHAVNAQLLALRVNDIGGHSIDPRTHYYGLVADNRGLGFMRGCANAIPDLPDPSSVASGPAGEHSSTLFSYDVEHASYAGWYAGHELAHALGRSHPGFCYDQEGYRDDRYYPFTFSPRGLIASASLEYVGWDSANQQYAFMKAIRGDRYFDIMTYCPFEWPSAYTYRALRRRLLCEQDLSAHGAPTDSCRPSKTTIAADLGPEAAASAAALATFSDAPRLAGAGPTDASTEGPGGSSGAAGGTGGNPGSHADDAAGARAGDAAADGSTMPQAVKAESPGAPDGRGHLADLESTTQEAIAVVASVNAAKKTGRVLHFIAASQAQLYASAPEIAPVKIRVLGEGDRVLFERGAPIMVDSEKTLGDGLVTIVVPRVEGIRAMQLIVGDTVTDTRRFGTEIPTISSVQAQLTKAGTAARAGANGTADKLRLTWATSNLPEPGTNAVTYTVQRSADSGQAWETIAVGLTVRELVVESPVADRARPYSYRIVASDGVHTTRTVTEPVVVPVQ